MLVTAVKPLAKLVLRVSCISSKPGRSTPTPIIVTMTALKMLRNAGIPWSAGDSCYGVLVRGFLQVTPSQETIFMVRGKEKIKERTKPTTPKTMEQVPWSVKVFIMTVKVNR